MPIAARSLTWSRPGWSAKAFPFLVETGGEEGPRASREPGAHEAVEWTGARRLSYDGKPFHYQYLGISVELADSTHQAWIPNPKVQNTVATVQLLLRR